MSNHDRSNHDRRIMSENPGVYIAMKSAVIRSSMGQKNLAVLTGDCINEGFVAENVWPFCWAANKSDRNNEVTVRQGFTVQLKR